VWSPDGRMLVWGSDEEIPKLWKLIPEGVQLTV
jgi:hypothetical protein